MSPRTIARSVPLLLLTVFFYLHFTDLTAQSGEAWSQYAHDAAHTARTTANGPNTPDIKWTYTADGTVSDVVVAADGSIFFQVYVSDYVEQIVALNADGTFRWKIQSVDARYSFPAIGNDGNVYYINNPRYSEEDQFVALNPTNGNVVWSFPIGQSSIGTENLYLSFGNHSRPVVDPDGTIYVTSTFGHNGYGTVFAVNPNGTQKWVWDLSDGDGFCTGHAPYTFYCGLETTPTLAPNGKLHIGPYSEGAIVLDSETGTFLNTLLDISSGQEQWANLGESLSVSADNAVYIGLTGPYFYAVKPDGSIKWKRRTYAGATEMPISGVSADDKIVYHGDNDGWLFAFNTQIGSTRWVFDVPTDYVTFSGGVSLAGNGILYFTTGETTSIPDGTPGYVYAVNADNGALIWQYEVGFSSQVLAIGPDGTLFVPTDGNQLIAFECEDGQCPPPSSPPSPVVANDYFEDAIDMGTASYSVTINDIEDATNEVSEPAHMCDFDYNPNPPDIYTYGTNSVWFKFTLVTTSFVTVDTRASSYSNLVSIYQGADIHTLVDLACVDTVGVRLLKTALDAGTYYVKVSNKWDDSPLVNPSTLGLSFSLQPANLATQNDNFANALLLANNNQTVYTGFIEAATIENGEPLHSCRTEGPSTGQHSVWYQFSLAQKSQVTIDLKDSVYPGTQEDNDTLVSVYSGLSIDTLTETACDDDGPGGIVVDYTSYISVLLNPGIYYIKVSDGTDNPAVLQAPTFLKMVFTLTPIPVNDLFEDAIEVTPIPYSYSQEINGSTVSNSDPTMSCALQKSNTVWFRFTPTLGGTVNVDTLTSTYDTVLGVYTGTKDNLTQVACNDQGGETSQSVLSFTGSAGTTYHIMVAKWGSTPVASSATLNFHLTAPIPPTSPSSLVTTAVSETQIDLTWTDNSSDETEFHIERSLDGGSWMDIGTDTASPYSDTGLSCDTLYTYRVRAHRHSDNVYSEYSNTDSTTTHACAPFNPPSLLIATLVAETQIDLTWSDNSNDETNFRIERSPDGSTWTEINTTVSASYSDMGLPCGTTFHYQVRAYRQGDGAYSAYSNTANATTPACPSMPQVFNGDFELGAPKPTGWKPMKLESIDKIQCSTTSGNCVMRMVGAALPAKNDALSQTITTDVANLPPLSSLRLSAKIKRQAVVAGGLIKLTVTYTDTTKKTVTRKIPVGNGGYTLYQTPLLSLAAGKTVAKISVVLQYNGASGKVYFDDVTLNVTP